MYFFISYVSQYDCENTVICFYKVLSVMGIQCGITLVVLNRHAILSPYFFVLHTYVMPK